jgi:O-antigen ligase
MSWLIREREISLALRDVIGQIIFGQGLGATIISPDRRFVLITPDNAYVYILWKMGVVGLISFLVMQFLFIKRCIFVLRRALVESDKIIALTGLLNIIGLLIVGFANACISQYEYLVIWTAIMGAVETTARKYE